MSTYQTTDCIITENLSGYIDLKDDLFQILWQAIDLVASVTIKIKNLSNHLMELKIESDKNIIIKIFPNDEQYVTVSNVRCITVQFSNNEKESCTGSYQIMIHYPLNFTKYCKNTKRFCDENNWCKMTNLHK